MTKKYEKLEIYIEEVENYLSKNQDTKDILTEIRAHILEKAEHEHGELSEEAIQQTISQYGTPREVAEKYMEGTHIINPAYRKFLFRYILVLFGIHYGVVCLAYLFNTGFSMFPPLFSIPRITSFFELLNQLPMILIYDLGLVGLVLFFITQMKGYVKLPWPSFFTNRIRNKEVKLYSPKKPKLYGLIFWLLFLTAAISVYIHFGSLFFSTLNLENPKPLFTPFASNFYSVLIIVSIGTELLAYTIRFIYNTYWVDLVKNFIFLTVLWIIINYPVKNAFNEFPDLDLKSIAAWTLSVLIILLSMETIGYIYKLTRNTITNRRLK